MLPRYILIYAFLLSLFLPTTKCSLLSMREGCAKERLSYGGRISLIDEGGLGYDSPPPWADQRIFVFRMPPLFFREGHHRSKFGHAGIGRIVVPHETSCAAERSHQICPLVGTNELSCLDPSLPCYDTPPTYSQLEPLSFSDVTPTKITVTWPVWNESVDKGQGPIVEYMIHIRGPDKDQFIKVPYGMQLSHHFYDLAENTTYEFQVTIIRDHPFGDGRPSNVQTHTTTTIDLSPALVISIGPSFGVNIELPSYVTAGMFSVTGYRIEYRKINSTDWISLEYNDTQPKQVDGILEEGYTYELRTSLKYGERYGTPGAIQRLMMPCRDIVVNLELSSSSRKNGMARVIADWTLRELEGPCDVINQTISVQQLDLDRCSTDVSDMMNTTIQLSNERHFRLTEMHANSKYNFSLTVITKTNMFNVWKKIRTAKTAPTGSPSLASTNFDGNMLYIRWDQLPCGQRNGKVKAYDIQMTRRGGSSIGMRNVKTRKATFTDFSVDQQFSVKLRAITADGVGPYSQKFVGTFGEDH